MLHQNADPATRESVGGVHANAGKAAFHYDAAFLLCAWRIPDWSPSRSGKCLATRHDAFVPYILGLAIRITGVPGLFDQLRR